MTSEFTDDAKIMWNSIPLQAQERILKNVWCTRCVGATTITNFKGTVENGDLILRGSCVTCGGAVTRLIEGE